MKQQVKKILILCPYPYDTAPNQRFRHEQYLEILERNGYQYAIKSFIDEQTQRIIYKKGYFFSKVAGILKGYLRRFSHALQARHYDFIFVSREAAPLGPPVFEWMIARLFRKKLIYDFDDAVWLPNTSENNKIVGFLKWHGKIASICKWSYKVSCGNNYLKAYAAQFNNNTVLNPTTIDTDHHHNRLKDQHTERVVIGWTGTHSTIPYLSRLIPVLQQLEQQYDFDFMVISNRAPGFKLRSLKYIPWSKEREIDDLMKFNFGVMPLEDNAWTRGKCGFKALQYMALGMPAVVSPVGVNTQIVTAGVNGFLCESDEDWYQALEQLILNASLREKMGRESRKTIIERYSVSSNASNFLSLFEVDI